MRTGVFICHCGKNIASSIDIEKLKEELSRDQRVSFVEDYMFLCSEPGQDLVLERIRSENLDSVVIANCSPTLHEKTFRDVASRAGINPYMVEIANIREQCSWPHQNRMEESTKKALDIISYTIEKASKDQPLSPISTKVVKKALVVGGGIAGIQCALDIADAGYEVYLVEKDQSIGGRMMQLSETFPTLDCPQCIETPKMSDTSLHPNIHLYTYSEIESIDGFVGDFKVGIKRKAKYIDYDKCNGCGACEEKCPVKVPSEFFEGLDKRKVVYRLFPQAVPNKPVIDAANCLYFRTGKCKLCEKVCDLDAINFDDEDRYEDINVGAIVLATGYELKTELEEFGYGRLKDVVSSLQFELLLSSIGPTNGEIKTSDGKVPKSVAFIQCAGSRDPARGVSYCSKVCCMYTAKLALLYRDEVADGKATVFYIDIRSDGKGYEEFVQRAMEEKNVLYIRGKASKVYRSGEKLIVMSTDTLTGRKIEMPVDMVVLANAIVPRSGAMELAKKAKIQTDEYGWFTEAHLKLRPLETNTQGIFIAGTCQFPKDITDTVSQASGAASKVLGIFSQDELYQAPLVAEVDEDLCTGCGYCEEVCAYKAVEVVDRCAKVNEVLCTGCGACAATCPSGAIQIKNFTMRQMISMIEAAEG